MFLAIHISNDFIVKSFQVFSHGIGFGGSGFGSSLSFLLGSLGFGGRSSGRSSGRLGFRSRSFLGFFLGSFRNYEREFELRKPGLV
jgi:hypothetical protein